MQPSRNQLKVILLILLALAIAGALIWRSLTPPEPSGPRISAQNLQAAPLLLQRDYPDAVTVFGGAGKSVWSSGCGAVTVAMALEYLTGESVSPQTMFEWAVAEGHYFGDGLGHEALTAMAEHYGLSGEWLDNDPGPVMQWLEAGYPVIAHMGPGTFTNGGHYIMLRGITDDGLVLVNDPGSRPRSETAHEMSVIVSELRRAKSFMVLRPKSEA